MFKSFLNDESGATAIEYGLIAGLIGVLLIVTVSTVGTQLSAVYDKIGTTLAGTLR